MDISPKRSPQKVHSLLATEFRGRDVVEAGSRVGDGLLCWARTARRATGIEVDAHACRILQRRAAESNVNASIVCSSFFHDTPDADVYTWWAQYPGLTTMGALAHLADLHRQRRIRPNAEATVLFDMTEQGDVLEWRTLGRTVAHATWTVRFDEFRACKLRMGWHRLCLRAKGTFGVLSVKLQALSAADAGSPLCARGWAAVNQSQLAWAASNAMQPAAREIRRGHELSLICAPALANSNRRE
eukprot:2331868-Prymnesium_polylepis.1